MFRGVIDEIRVHGSRLDGTGALTLDQILAVQRSSALSAQAAIPARFRVTENQRFLLHEDGTPFFWLGDTAWELFSPDVGRQVEQEVGRRPYLNTRHRAQPVPLSMRAPVGQSSAARLADFLSASAIGWPNGSVTVVWKPRP